MKWVGKSELSPKNMLSIFIKFFYQSERWVNMQITNKEPIILSGSSGTWHSAPGVSSSSVPGLNIPMMRVTGAQEYNKTMTASNPVPVIRTPGVLNIKSANVKSCGPINSIASSFSFQTSLLMFEVHAGIYLHKTRNTHRDSSTVLLLTDVFYG